MLSSLLFCLEVGDIWRSPGVPTGLDQFQHSEAATDRVRQAFTKSIFNSFAVERNSFLQGAWRLVKLGPCSLSSNCWELREIA